MSRRPRGCLDQTCTTSASSTESLWLPRWSTGTNRRPVPPKGAGASKRMPGRSAPWPKAPLVEHLGDVAAHVRVHAPRLLEEQPVRPPPWSRGRRGCGRAPTWPCPAGARPSAADRAAARSPSSTMPFEEGADASTLASDICPASSTKSTSTESTMSSRANSHAVPATTFASPRAALRAPRRCHR